MMTYLKQAIRNFLTTRLGYEIRKIPLNGYIAAPIFDLAVQYLMLRENRALSFIQVGANDGVYGDPLREYILRYNWKGILVEPQPDIFSKLKANYVGREDQLFFENVAVSNELQEVIIYRARSSTGVSSTQSVTYASSVASTNQKIASRQLNIKGNELEKVVVPAIRLDSLVEKYSLIDFDLLQIDTEGHEWHVIQSLDMARNRPSLIQFEHGHLSPREIGKISDHLKERDYFLHFGGHESDSIAMRRDLFIKWRK